MDDKVSGERGAVALGDRSHMGRVGPQCEAETAHATLDAPPGPVGEARCR